MMNVLADVKRELAGRAGVYELFAHLLLNEVDSKILSLFHDEQWLRCWQDLEIEIPAVSEAGIEMLAVDYCRIFIGPKDFCPPYQSVWEDGHMQSDVITSMNEYVEIVSSGASQNIKDHAGVQFKMMSQILQFEAASDEPPSTLAHAFFVDHIAWTEPMFSLASTLAETDFYSTVLESGKEFVTSEKSVFSLDAID